MTDLHPQLAAHLQRHARMLYRVACGFGRRTDGEDIVQTLYARWWRRLRDEPGWTLPETHSELFLCVRRVVIDVAAKEKRDRCRHQSAAGQAPPPDSAEDSLHAFERLQWIVARLPAPFAEVLTASLSAGRRDDTAIAQELGLTVAAFTTRLFRARRAAEELASFYELLPLNEARLLAELRYSGKTRAQVAHDLGMLPHELTERARRATDILDKSRRAAS